MKSMQTIRRALVFGLAATAASTALAWDPIGDLQNPHRIIRNVEREARSAGAAIDRARIEANAQMYAPALAQWLNASRNTALNGGVQPIPPQIRRQLTGFIEEDILNRVRFKVGDSGVFNLAALSIQYGGAAAVALIDVVVFRSAQDAFNNAQLWAHELRHIQQFRDWGTHDFAIRYLRSWNSVEAEADAAETAFASWRQRPVAGPMNGPFGGGQRGNFCGTPWGRFGPGPVLPVGETCHVMTPQGPILGRVTL